MRISTMQFYTNSAANNQRAYSNVVKTGEEASDQLRIRSAADDPVGAARLLQLEQQQKMLEQYAGNITNVRNALGTSEATLTSITNILQKVNELTISSGNAGFTDADRKANADELSALEEQLFSLMNSKDENGKYLFSGSKGDTQPYVRNADGTYSYKGDQSSLNLQVGDMLSLAASESGYSAFEQALNTSRSQTSADGVPATGSRINISNGQVSGSAVYNDRFRSGEPYKIEFISSTQFKITEVNSGKDVTLEATQGGTFNPNATNNSINFRGVDLRLDVKFEAGDSANPDAAIAGHSFNLSSKPDSIVGTRSPGNPSSSQVTGASITDPTLYKAAFPGGGAVLKFTSANDFELYAAPVTADSRPVASGSLVGNTATAAGVSFTVTGAPNAPVTGDSFAVKVDTHQTQNILDTISHLRKALNTPLDGADAATKQNFQASLDAAIGNVASAANQVSSSIASIGGRGQAIDVQAETNEAIGAENKKTQDSIRLSDHTEVLVRLTMQQNVLQASMQAYVKVASLSLINYI